ncbi:hypothetical protein MMC19_004766 [Ptychographa xylographoides]|nr:hypothetical protein [Ptychographa xylographoides]
MKYSTAFLAAALATFASAQNYTAPLVTSTVYTTQEITITSCAPTVVSCPAESTVITTVTVAAYTTVCPLTMTSSAAAVSSYAPLVSSTSTVAAVPITSAAPISTVSTLIASPCPSNATTVAPKMITRPAVSTTVCASGSSAGVFSVVPTGSPIATVAPGSAPKVAGSVGGAVVLLLAAFML